MDHLGLAVQVVLLDPDFQFLLLLLLVQLVQFHLLVQLLQQDLVDQYLLAAPVVQGHQMLQDHL